MCNKASTCSSFNIAFNDLLKVINNEGPKSTGFFKEVQLGEIDFISCIVDSFKTARFRPNLSISSHANIPKLPEDVIIAMFFPFGKG